MKQYILLVLMAVCFGMGASAKQINISAQGKCGNDVHWTFDGKTLTISNASKTKPYVSMNNYSISEKAPWISKRLPVKSVHIGEGIDHIGSCAFVGCTELTEVVFEDAMLESIGWGAFMNCTHLRSISLPVRLKKIETIAFAGCTTLPSVRIPDQCRVEDQAFINCSNIQGIEVSPTAQLGQYVFANEVEVNGEIRHSLYNGEIRRLPSHINSGNAHLYGISNQSMTNYLDLNGGTTGSIIDYDYATAELDTIIPATDARRRHCFALIIGNQNYRYVSNVPFAIHDARVFKEYCETTLGIPNENILIAEDATKQMIDGEGFEWLNSIDDRESKNLIVYYAGHGVPDTKDQNKAYMLPTDVRGSKPYHGIALDDFYGRIGDLAFNQTTIFLDACFSGINRDNESVDEGTRGVEITAEETTINSGNVVVFSAAQGNETAQGYQEQGHGLFTYYLLKELHDTYGETTYGQLSDNIKNNVKRQAMRLKLRKPQTPDTRASESIDNKWRYMRF